MNKELMNEFLQMKLDMEEMRKVISMNTKDINDIKQVLKITKQNTKKTPSQVWRRNAVDEYNIKVVYPGIFEKQNRTYPVAAFPSNREAVVRNLCPEKFIFPYVTNPVKKIIGFGRVTSTIKNFQGRWPIGVDFEWVIGPKSGFTLAELDIDIRMRPGDTIFALSPIKAQEIINKLRTQPDLEDSVMDFIAAEYNSSISKI